MLGCGVSSFRLLPREPLNILQFKFQEASRICRRYFHSRRGKILLARGKYVYFMNLFSEYARVLLIARDLHETLVTEKKTI